MGHFSTAGTLMYYILTHHFYCDFCHMKKYRRQKSYGSGLLGKADDELVCENLVYALSEVLNKPLLTK